MNCKPGDLAIVTRGPFQGGMVECEDVCDAWSYVLGGPIWHVKPASASMALVNHVADRILRPLRDEPGRDETLEWAPSPSVLEAL